MGDADEYCDSRLNVVGYLPMEEQVFAKFDDYLMQIKEKHR